MNNAVLLEWEAYTDQLLSCLDFEDEANLAGVSSNEQAAALIVVAYFACARFEHKAFMKTGELQRATWKEWSYSCKPRAPAQGWAEGGDVGSMLSQRPSSSVKLSQSKLLTQPWPVPRFSKFFDFQCDLGCLLPQFNVFRLQHL
jgi:hypothetical protein